MIRLLFSPLPGFLDVWLGSLVAHSLTVPFAAASLTTAYFTLTAGRSVGRAGRSHADRQGSLRASLGIFRSSSFGPAYGL